MQDVQVTTQHFKTTKLVDFLSKEDQESLTEKDFELIKNIEDGIMPGGLIIPGFSTSHEGMYEKMPKRTVSFIQWSAIVELAIDEDKLYFHSVASCYPVEFENPVVLEGAYNLFGWHLKQFLTHPAPIPYRTESIVLNSSNVKYTTGE